MQVEEESKRSDLNSSPILQRETPESSQVSIESSKDFLSIFTLTPSEPLRENKPVFVQRSSARERARLFL